MRVLVCGSRDWNDSEPIYRILDGYGTEAYHDDDPYSDHPTPSFGHITIIEGGARGADSIAAEWVDLTVQDVVSPSACPKHEQYPADWSLGKSAGFIRNKRMLEVGKPDVVYAFSDYPVTTGTAMMVKLAKDAGVPTYVIGHG